jgi:hypothetical protein
MPVITCNNSTERNKKSTQIESIIQLTNQQQQCHSSSVQQIPHIIHIVDTSADAVNFADLHSSSTATHKSHKVPCMAGFEKN